MAHSTVYQDGLGSACLEKQLACVWCCGCCSSAQLASRRVFSLNKATTTTNMVTKSHKARMM